MSVKALPFGLALALLLTTTAWSAGSRKALLELQRAAGVHCRVALDGRPLHAGAFDLHEGLNVLTVVASGQPGWVAPVVTIGSQRIEADEGWQCRTTQPPPGWQTAVDGEGFSPAGRRGKGIWAPDAGAAAVYLRRGLVLSPPGPRVFPPGASVWMPAGTSQRIKPYLARPPGPHNSGYSLCLTVPSWLRYVAADAMEGFKPEAVQAIGTARMSGRSYTTYRATYGPFPSSALDVTVRWLYADGTTLNYQPCLRAGGSFNWRHWSGVVKAPPRAAKLHVLVRKQGGLGITGRFCVDNVTVRRVGSDENLAKMGDFESPDWHDGRMVAGAGVGGSKGFVVDCTPERSEIQDALWVPLEALPTRPGTDYVVEMDARAQDLQQPGETPVASLLFAADAGVKPGTDTMRTYFEAQGGAVTEVAQPVPVQALPPLLNVRPRQIQIIPCMITDCFSDPAVNRAMAENTWRAGMNATWGTADNQVVDLLRRKHGVPTIVTLHTVGMWQWPAALRDAPRTHPEWCATEYPDCPSAVYMCPTWALTEGEAALAAVENWVVANVRRTEYAGVDWDVEYPIVNPPTVCFCPRCVEAFRREAGLPVEARLTPEALVGEYRARWTDFRLRQNAQLVARVRHAVKSADPALPFDVYSGVQGTYAKERCGVDWTLLAPHLDLAMAGGTREELRATRAALGQVPLIGYECYYASHFANSGPAPDPRTWRNRLVLQCIQSGGRGVLIWYLPALDGGALYETSEAAAVLARYESTIRANQRCDSEVAVTGLPPEHWAALQRGPERLVMLLNFEDKPAEVSVTLPTQWRKVVCEDPVSGRPIRRQAGPTARCTIPPFGVVALRALAG